MISTPLVKQYKLNAYKALACNLYWSCPIEYRGFVNMDGQLLPTKQFNLFEKPELRLDYIVPGSTWVLLGQSTKIIISS